jgi:hypothetical protein
MGLQLPNGFDFVETDVPLRIKQGQLAEITVQIVDDKRIVQDITGRTYTGKIGVGDGTAAVASFTYVITDPINGIVKFSLSSAASAGITAGHYRWEVWEEGTNHLWSGPVEVVKKEIL